MAAFGSQVCRFDEVSSTNDAAREMAMSGEPEGTIVVALAQTAGRGRQGRSWSSPPGVGLYFSVILRPSGSPASFPIVTLAAAVAVAETLKEEFGLNPDIKWPNDILAGGRKICGILVESATEGDKIQHAVMGIGVNLTQQQFHEEVVESATSLLAQTGRAVSPDEMLAALTGRLEYWYRLSASEPPRVISRWEELSSFARDCAVTVTKSDGLLLGVTRGLTSRGSLLVQPASGDVVEVLSGEVSVRKSAD